MCLERWTEEKLVCWLCFQTSLTSVAVWLPLAREKAGLMVRVVQCGQASLLNVCNINCEQWSVYTLCTVLCALCTVFCVNCVQ